MCFERKNFATQGGSHGTEAGAVVPSNFAVPMINESRIGFQDEGARMNCATPAALPPLLDDATQLIAQGAGQGCETLRISLIRADK
jgi:hypothetical protein